MIPAVSRQKEANRAAAVALSIAKWTGLALLWCVQYLLYVPFIGIPLAFLRVGGKLTLIILALSVVGLPIVIVWLLLRGRPEPKVRRSMWKPWGLA